jgi:cytochrome P450
MATAEFDREAVRELYDLRSSRQQGYTETFEGDFDAELSRLRDAAPVHEGTVLGLIGARPHDPITGYSENHYACFSWEVCSQALRDNETYSSGVYELAQRAAFGRTFKEMDGAEHRRNRELISHKFVRTRMDWWINRFVQDAADELLDRLADDGRADLNLQFFSMLPLHTITSAYGIPRAEALQWADAFASAPDVWAKRGEQTRTMIRPLIAERRLQPRDDLLSELIHTEMKDDSGRRVHLTDDQVIGISGVLFTGGIRTTWRQLGMVTLALLTHQDQLEAVRADRTLIRHAIEESMRSSPAVSIVRRFVTRDVVLEGVHIPKGAVLEVCLASANRDPKRWADPSDYDVRRRSHSNMGFILGPHVCLGMHLARAEMTVALNGIFDRLRDLRLDPGAGAPRIIGGDHRGVSSLPVVWNRT